mgnify:CR=1 FL=1
MTGKERCIVLLSGGLDSSVLAYWVRDRVYEVYALTCRYGQTATKEVECAIHIAEGLGAPMKVIDLSSLQEIFTGFASPSHVTIPSPSRFRLIFLSTAVTYACAIDAQRVYYGAQGSDPRLYHVWRRDFYESFQTAARLATGQHIRIEAPFSKTSKSTMVELGLRLGVPFELTWSCYLNGMKHCGTCQSCLDRKKAFNEANVPDPTEYVK